MWRSEVNTGSLPLSLSTLFFKTVLLDDLARLVGQWAVRYNLSPFDPSTGAIMYLCCHISLWCEWVLWIQTLAYAVGTLLTEPSPQAPSILTLSWKEKKDRTHEVKEYHVSLALSGLESLQQLSSCWVTWAWYLRLLICENGTMFGTSEWLRNVHWV